MVDEDTTTKTVIIWELIFDEHETLDKVIYRGLGFGVDKSGIPSHSLPYTISCENEGVITIKEEEDLDTKSPTVPIDYGKLQRELSLKSYRFDVVMLRLDNTFNLFSNMHKVKHRVQYYVRKWFMCMCTN